MNPARVDYSRRRANRFMRTPIVIKTSETGTLIYTGKCNFKAAEADQGQLSEPDPIEGDISSYESYNIWIPYLEHLLTDVLPGHYCQVNNRIDLTITAVEEDATHKTAIQLRGARQRTATPREMIVLVRINPDTGIETILPAQAAQVVFDSGTPIGLGQEVTGGSVSYLPGYLVFADRDANVLAGDRFIYRGRPGEVTGIPTVANDRLEARMRVAGGGY